jgi:diguanylate cyclase (GGDEF)-like protein
VEPELEGAGTATAVSPPGRGTKNRCILADATSILWAVNSEPAGADAAVARLAAEMSEAGWSLALEFVQEGLRDDTIPSLARLGELGQLGDVPIFISELARELADPEPSRLRPGGELATRVRDHAREREAVGFAPREIVTEFLLLRRVLWRFVSERSSTITSEDVLVVEQRLNDLIDRLVTECVVAYFDRVTADLAYQARRDLLTELLNHQAFADELELEFERARRYGHGLTLVFFDVDDFKLVNDTYGHPEGDRVLRVVAHLIRERLRRSDLAGRMGGDEFAVVLIESDIEAGGHFLARIGDGIDECIARSELPAGFSISPGLAHFPTDADSAATLYKLADVRLYEAKRAKQAR